MHDVDELVRQCQQGQLDAFSLLFKQFKQRIYDVACVIMRDESAAEDIVQETFLSVFQKIGSYKGEAAFETWLTSISVNHCRMRLRKDKLRQVLHLEQLSPRRLFRLNQQQDSVSRIVSKRAQNETLWDAVDRLPDRLRIPLILRYRYALPCSEISQILNQRTSSVYGQLHEGRRELKKILEGEEVKTAVPSAGGAK